MPKADAFKFKKGRPSKNAVLAKEEEDKQMTGQYQCQFCKRIFPRKKSLDAHVRIHLDIKPYKCDFPLCTSAFTQSGQCRSHIYLHTGEKPYACPATGCKKRYAHSNRKCPTHHSLKLVRDGQHKICKRPDKDSPAQQNWFRMYREKYYPKAAKSAKGRNVERESAAVSANLVEESADRDLQILQNLQNLHIETLPESSNPVEKSSESGYGSHPNSVTSSPPREEMEIDFDENVAAKVLLELRNGFGNNSG